MGPGSAKVQYQGPTLLLKQEGWGAPKLSGAIVGPGHPSTRATGCGAKRESETWSEDLRAPLYFNLGHRRG